MTSVDKNPYPYLYDDRKLLKKFNEMLDNPITYDTSDLEPI